MWKLSILLPLWQYRSYFPPALPLECLSMSPAPSLNATKHRAGHTTWDTQTVIDTHIPTEAVPGRPQTCYHYHTAPLSGTSIATVSPNHYPVPRLIHPASGQASPAQLCVIQARPGWHKSTLHLRHPLHPSLHLSHPNLSHHLSLDGWGFGIDGRPSARRPCHRHLLGELKESERKRGVCLPASQLSSLRAAASKNAVPCRRTLTHCHRAVQCDWSGPFSWSSQVWRRPGPPVAPPAPLCPI